MKKWNLIFTFITFSLLFTQDIQLELANLDSVTGNYTVDLLIDSSVDVAGYQFVITGGILSDVSGGLTADNQFIVTSSELGVVLAFDFLGGVIPAGEGMLVQLELSEITDSEICLEDPIFSALDGTQYAINPGGCLATGLGSDSPTVNILEPEDGTIILGDIVTVSLLTSDPNNVGYHYHLYLDESMIGMYYNNYFELENLDWGIHTLTVTLADSSHVECADASCSQSVSFTLEEPSPETIELTISDVDPVSRSFHIYTNNSIAFSSFEFDIEGVNPVSILGGGIDEFDFVSNIINNSIDGVSFTNSFPSGNNHFSTIYYDNPTESEICITNALFTDINDFDMITTVNGCAEIVLPINDFYISNLPESGVNQLIYFSTEIEGLQPGDEIGIFDQSGVTVDGADCDNLAENEILVGEGLMLYEGISIIATGSVDMCGWGGFITPGYNLGNPISIKVYRPSEMTEYETENIMFSNSAGTFTELFTEITSLHLVNELTNSTPNAVIDQESIETYRYTDIALDGSSSSDSDGNIVSYNWYLNGEELIGTQQSLTYQFTALGDYLITLVVTDNEGAIGSAVSVVSVMNQPPTEISLISPANQAILVIFSNDEFENAFVSFSWYESFDLDNDDLFYTLNVWKTNAPEEHNIEIELDETSFNANYNSEYFDLEFGTDEQFSWKINVSDGFDEVDSEINLFNFQFGTESMEEINPYKFSLSQNYPNPFNPNTEIQFSLDKSEHVYLDVFDISGRHIIQLLNGKQNIGDQTINWNTLDKNGTFVPAGLYIYKLNSNSNGTIKKTMTLLK